MSAVVAHNSSGFLSISAFCERPARAIRRVARLEPVHEFVEDAMGILNEFSRWTGALAERMEKDRNSSLAEFEGEWKAAQTWLRKHVDRLTPAAKAADHAVRTNRIRVLGDEEIVPHKTLIDVATPLEGLQKRIQEVALDASAVTSESLIALRDACATMRRHVLEH